MRVAQRTRCTPAEFCMGGAPNPTKICHAFARFLAKFFRTSEVRKVKEKMRKGYITMESQQKNFEIILTEL